MKIGLQIPYFTWAGGPPELGPRLAEIAHTADQGGFDSIWVMDHHFQIPFIGAAELDMLEGYTTLGFLAAHTSRVSLGTMVTGVTYRYPGVLVKQVSTLDVLSGGRAWLGIGAAWFEREHLGLGVPFPPLRERFERLEETLQIAHQMWNPDNNGRFEGKHYNLAETLNVPVSLSRPHPRVLIGGRGEKKTLRLVAKYGDAWNIPGASPEELRQKLEILRGHCEREGRNYNDIEKSVLFVFNPGPNGENTGQVLEQLHAYAEAGAQTVIGSVIGVENIAPVEAMARDVIPAAAKL